MALAISTGIIMLIALGFALKADRENRSGLLLPVLATLSVIAHMTALIIFFAQAG